MAYPWTPGEVLTATDLNAAIAATQLVTATGSTTARSAADRFADVVSAKDFGVVADGVTDDTEALQEAINAAQASGANWVETPGRELLLPHGRILAAGVTITAPVNIKGHGKWGTVIVLKAGSTTPAISISLATTAFSSVSGFASVSLRDLQITSPSRVDGPGQGVAHGLSLLKPASSQTVAVVLDRVLINAVPGDAIHSTGLTGFVEATDCEIAYPGGYGIYANSVFDWVWTSGNIYGAIQDNILLSGTTNFRFDRLNVFVGDKTNFNLFNSDLVVVNSMLDQTGTDGIFVNNQTGARVDFVGCTFRWASTGANATYSDLQFSAPNTGNVYLANCIFKTPASSTSANKPLNNINFTAGNTGLAILSNTSFDLGAPSAAGVTNSVQSIVGSIIPLTLRAATPTLNLDDSSQSSGLRRMVISNNSQTLQVYSATDVGVLGTLGLTIARNGLVTAPVAMNVLALGVTGILTQTASTPVWNMDDSSQSSGLRRMVISNNSQTLQVYSATDVGVLGTLGLMIARNGVVTAPVVLKCGQFAANGNAASAKIVISGSRGGATATVLASLLTAMATFGLITDSTTV